ncbi:MAG: SagB/ThcOx family dehydrogenase [Myxococcota bacterium]
MGERRSVGISRRGLFRLLGGGLLLLGGGSICTRAESRASVVHRATRNTRLGALGERALPWVRPVPFKSYAGARRMKLPAVATEPARALAEAVRSYAPASGFQAAPLSLGQLGRVLYFTNGATRRFRGGNHRAAPSAGALYAGEVYVAAERVLGLRSGIYYYAVGDHELVQLRVGSFSDQVAQSLERPGEVEHAAAVILLTNVFRRYTGRYANRGYRYALIDSGHIGENLRLATVSAGFGETGPLRFHDDLLDGLLGVDGREEAVCAFHAVGIPLDSSSKAPRAMRKLVEKGRADPGTLPRRGSAIECYHEATKLVPAGAEGERSGPAAADPPHEVAASSRGGMALPKPGTCPRTSVEEAIRKRCSVRSFRAEPVALDDLGFVLEMAQGHTALRRAAGVDLYLAAHQIEGLEPGLYRYQPLAHQLALVQEGDLRGAMIRACLGQERAGSAAAGLLMVGRVAEAASHAGDRAYRYLLLESGGIAQRIYLAAAATGLGARNLAAFVDDDLNRLAGLDGRLEAVIHLTMLGPR